jgi:RNA polymerase sigma-70 factor (ECF subfamily)
MSTVRNPTSSEDVDQIQADWLERSSKGDLDAFHKLYLATSPRLLGVIALLTGRGAVAEDLLQDVYLRIWKASGQFRAGSGTPMAWMAAMARYRAIDHLRARGARPEISAADLAGAGDTGDPDDELAQRMADVDADPSKDHEHGLLAGALGRCVQELHGMQRQTICLAYYQGLTHSEIAQRLAVPQGSVKTWARRGLATLKACLERCGWSGAGS